MHVQPTPAVLDDKVSVQLVALMSVPNLYQMAGHIYNSPEQIWLVNPKPDLTDPHIIPWYLIVIPGMRPLVSDKVNFYWCEWYRLNHTGAGSITVLECGNLGELHPAVITIALGAIAEFDTNQMNGK